MTHVALYGLGVVCTYDGNTWPEYGRAFRPPRGRKRWEWTGSTVMLGGLRVVIRLGESGFWVNQAMRPGFEICVSAFKYLSP